MIETYYYSYAITSLFDVNEEISISDQEFSDLVNMNFHNLISERGVTYRKYWFTENGVKTGHYIVKRILGVKCYE